MTGTGSAPVNRDAFAEAKRRRASLDYVGGSEPSTPAAGEAWYDTEADALKVYDGDVWTPTVFVVRGAAPGVRPGVDGTPGNGGGA